MRRGTEAQRHRGTATTRLFCASVPLCLCASLLSCTDPRARPAPPIVDLSVAPSFQLTSPGDILGSVYAFDEDGLDNLTLSVRSAADTSLNADSLILLSGDPETTRQVHWTVPAGLPVGSRVDVVARVVDFLGFASSDSLHLTVQSAVSGVR